MTRAVLGDAIALVRGDRFYTTSYTPVSESIPALFLRSFHANRYHPSQDRNDHMGFPRLQA